MWVPRTFAKQRLYFRDVCCKSLRNAEGKRAALPSAATATDEGEDVERPNEAGDTEWADDTLAVAKVRAITAAQNERGQTKLGLMRH